MLCQHFFCFFISLSPFHSYSCNFILYLLFYIEYSPFLFYGILVYIILGGCCYAKILVAGPWPIACLVWVALPCFASKKPAYDGGQKTTGFYPKIAGGQCFLPKNSHRGGAFPWHRRFACSCLVFVSLLKLREYLPGNSSCGRSFLCLKYHNK